MVDKRRLKKLVKDKEPYLNALKELDRTGKLRKVRYKERVNFTIDEQVMNRYRKYCRKNSISMSNKIEMLVKEFLKAVDK